MSGITKVDRSNDKLPRSGFVQPSSWARFSGRFAGLRPALLEPLIGPPPAPTSSRRWKSPRKLCRSPCPGSRSESQSLSPPRTDELPENSSYHRRACISRLSGFGRDSTDDRRSHGCPHSPGGPRPATVTFAAVAACTGMTPRCHAGQRRRSHRGPPGSSRPRGPPRGAVSNLRTNI